MSETSPISRIAISAWKRLRRWIARVKRPDAEPWEVIAEIGVGAVESKPQKIPRCPTAMMMPLMTVSDSDPLAHFTRYRRWVLRTGVPLGFYAEHWKPTRMHPGSNGIRELGGEPSETEWHITGQLITGVIYAAGGVEYAVSKLIAAIVADEAYMDEFAPHVKAAESGTPGW